MATSPSSRWESVDGFRRRHGPIATVLGLFAAAAIWIVPTMTPAPVGDDWVYARSVEILFREGELRILDLSVVTLVFQVLWGTLFAAIFGVSFGAMRLSTVVLVLLAGWALYGVCRELGVDRGRSALGAAAYLFNPLAFVLSYTFMSDPHFTALLIVATLGYLRGLRPYLLDAAGEGRRDWALRGGAVGAALAFLVRQQGALIPLAVVVALLLARRLRFDRASLVLFGRIVAIPAVTVVVYYLWLFFVHGIPEQQRSFTQQVREAGWDDTWLLLQRMTFVEAMHIGFFVLPIAAAALVGIGRLPRFRSPLGWVLAVGWAGLLTAGLEIVGRPARSLPPMTRMPYIAQYIGPTGLGPFDLYGNRAWLITPRVLDWLTGLCAAASFLFGLALCRRVGRPRRPDATRGVAGVALSIGLWQVIGILPPSFHFRNWILSVDRYLLPLIPFAVCLCLWALRDVRLSLPVAWVAVAVYGVVAVAGTHDLLSLQEATWNLSRSAAQMGVPVTRLDGGASWDGYHLYEYSAAVNSEWMTPGGPWWTHLFAKATDSSYVVSGTPWAPAGYDVLGQTEYSSWLDDDPTYLYLLRRHGMPGSP